MAALVNADFRFYDPFSLYGPAGYRPTLSGELAGMWNSFGGGGANVHVFPLEVGPPLIGTNGQSFRLINSGSAGVSRTLNKTLPANFARVIGGCYVQAEVSDFTVGHGWTFSDGVTDQVSIRINVSTGTVSVVRGGLNGTVIATSAESVTDGSVHSVVWDITFHNTAGAFKVLLDGAVLANLNLSSQNTRVSANNFFNVFKVANAGTSDGIFAPLQHLFLWCYLSSSTTDVAPNTSPIIDTQDVINDSSVQFTVGAETLGEAYSATTTTDAPGANQLVLRKVTAKATGTLNSVSIVPAATSATAKFKAVFYADSAGSSGALTATGTEVVGCTNGATLTMSFAVGQAIAEGVDYWIGYITDTSVAIRRVDTTTVGQKKANTYASGAPNPAGVMTTGQATWEIFGNVTGVSSANFSALNVNPPLGDRSFTTSSTALHEDLFGVNAPGSTPQVIYDVAVAVNLAKTDAGSRTIDVRMASGASASSGSAPGQSPAVTYQWAVSNFALDPDTGDGWAPANLVSSKIGYRIAS
jgi:hypothetical protein